jgi:hypothetical protein
MGETERDLRAILSNRATATAAIFMILATGMLEQFKAVDAQAAEE